MFYEFDIVYYNQILAYIHNKQYYIFYFLNYSIRGGYNFGFGNLGFGNFGNLGGYNFGFGNFGNLAFGNFTWEFNVRLFAKISIGVKSLSLSLLLLISITLVDDYYC